MNTTPSPNMAENNITEDFTHIFDFEKFSGAETAIKFNANNAECRAIAARLNIAKVKSMKVKMIIKSLPTQKMYHLSAKFKTSYIPYLLIEQGNAITKELQFDDGFECHFFTNEAAMIRLGYDPKNADIDFEFLDPPQVNVAELVTQYFSLSLFNWQEDDPLNIEELISDEFIQENSRLIWSSEKKNNLEGIEEEAKLDNPFAVLAKINSHKK